MAAQRHILSELRLELLIYRILLIAPFEILRNQQLATTWKIRLYMCSMLLVYITLRVTYSVQFEDNDTTNEYLYNNGKLWMIVYLFDYIFSTLSFGGLVLNGLFTTTYQIEFFKELQHFDAILNAAFGVPIKRSRIRTANQWALVVGLAYFIGYFFKVLTKFGTTILTPYQHFAYYFTFYLDNILGLITALYFVTCTQLCAERLQCVRKLLRNYSNFSTKKLGIVLELYVRIRSQLFLINRFMGFLIILKISHDFSLGSSIVYMIFCSLKGDKVFNEFVTSIKWFCETVIGTILMILAAEMLLAEV